MWALNKCSYTEAFVRIAGQMGGGLVAFPLFHYISLEFNLTPFGGPEFVKENDVDSFISEFVASFILMWVIYIVRKKNRKIGNAFESCDGKCFRRLGIVLLHLNFMDFLISFPVYFCNIKNNNNRKQHK